jgi:DNA-binding response OmpR family regulator
MSRGTILFLDDDKDLQKLVSVCLRSQGYEVEPALDVKQARTLLSGIRVHAAIVDGLLPGMTGTDFIQELRQTHPTLPILFASASWKDLESHEQLTRELKVSRVLHKPYAPQDLLGWVEQVLAVRPPPPEAPAQGTSADDDLDATFRALCARYGAGLGEKARALTAAMERARAGSAEALEEAYELAHKLAGTAGSYGFGAVSVAARTLEVELKRAWDGKAAADWKALEAAQHALVTETTHSSTRPLKP